MKMKKWLLLICTLALTLALLCACGGDKDEAAPATAAPTTAPTEEPTAAPTEEPTTEPTEEPTPEPTEEPTPEPTEEPTPEPTEEPTPEPTEEPTPEPTEEPTPAPTEEPEAEVIGGADAETEIVVADAEATGAEATESEATDGEAGEDAVLATAYGGEIAIRKSDAQSEFDDRLAAYISMYAQYGYEMDEYDTDFQSSVAQETVQNLLSQRIVDRRAADEGYALTDEKANELLAQAQTASDSIREYYESYLSYYGYEGEELQSAVEDELTSSGYTVDALYDTLCLNDKLDFLYELATADVTVTDEDVVAAFAAKIEAAKESYADIDAFIDAYMNGEDVVYTPEGVRLVECIYVAPDPADEATPDEATEDEAAADEATPGEADPSELTGKAKAEAVRARIAGGMDFAEACAAYDENASDGDIPQYAIAEGTTLYGEEFAAAAMALAEAGDVSDVVETSSGLFILRYAGDLTPGEAKLEDREDAEADETLTAKKDDAFSAYVDAMLADAGIEYGDLTPLYHVYTSVSVEATVAYAKLTREAKLTDMPEGDEMAALSEGATLDILGRIGMDGEEYVFAAVPGTLYKGYVNAADIEAAEETDALAVDNEPLVKAAELLPDKKPTFTIAMNDGSLIYGELYPETAPETVGNFVELAGKGFYDGLTFHRVIAGFMIQGGDPNGDGTGGPGYSITGEFESNGVKNDISHLRGVLSMARSSAANSGGSQFFIMHADNDYLDGDYAAFGQVLGGIETVDLIASVPTNSNDMPTIEQTMRTVYVETYGKTYAFTKLDD